MTQKPAPRPLKPAQRTPAELRKSDAQLYGQLAARVKQYRLNVLRQLFMGSAPELQEVVRRLRVPEAGSPDAVRSTILAELREAKLPPALLRDAERRLESPAVVELATDPLADGTPVGKIAILQGELARLEIADLSRRAGLTERAAAILQERAPAPHALDAGLVAELVEAGALDSTAAARLAKTATFDNLLDGEPALVELVASRVAEPRALASWDAETWSAALAEAGLETVDGQPRAEYARALERRLATLYPTDALVARLLPSGAAAVAAELASANDTERIRLVNRFPGLGLAELLADVDMAPDERDRRVGQRLALIDQLWRDNPDLELLELDLSPGSGDLASIALGSAAATDRLRALAFLKAYQRMYALTGDVLEAQLLLEHGYDSAMRLIAERGKALFEDPRLATAEAGAYLERAWATVGRATSVAGSIVDMVLGGLDWLAVDNAGPSITSYLREIPGFESLFGSQAACNCAHCQSVLSPAAYFVDLMRFVEAHILEPIFEDRPAHVLNLAVRRPDLWTLPLTCENTDKTLPTLEIINEIMESFIAVRGGYSGALTNRSAVERAVYRQALGLADSHDLEADVRSFAQPFTLPNERLKTYLAHFDRTWGDVARTLGAAPERIVAAELGIAPAVQDLITHPRPSEAFLERLYRVPLSVGAGGAISALDVQALLGPVGVSRAEIGLLVDTWFVRGTGASLTIRAERASSESIQNDIERLHGASIARLDRLHRFVRLWRTLPWSIAELDLVLEQLGAQSLDASDLGRLVDVRRAQVQLRLTVEETCALFGPIPSRPVAAEGTALLARLFNPPAVVRTDGAWPQGGASFMHPAFRVSDADEPVTPARPRLLGALKIADHQLVALITGLALPLGLDLDSANEADRSFALSHEHLTLLYRHTRLAQRLELSISELFRLIGLAPAIAAGHIATLQDVGVLLELHGWYRASGRSLDDLARITGGTVLVPSAYPDPAALVRAVLEGVAADRALIFADTVFAYLDGVTEEHSRRLVEASVAAGAMLALPEGKGAGYWLAPGFDPSALTVPDDVPIDAAAAAVLLVQYRAAEILPARLAAALGLPVDKTLALLTLLGADPSDPVLTRVLQGSAPPDALVGLVQALLPLALVFASPALGADSVRFVGAHPGLFGIASFAAVDLAGVRKLSVYTSIVRGVDLGYTSAVSALDPSDLHAVLLAFDPAHGFGSADLTRLARVVRADAALVASLRTSLNFPGGALEALAMLAANVALAMALGISGQALPLFGAAAYDDIAQAADEVLAGFRAKYADEATWEQKLEPFEDRIRTRKRDGLVDYMLRAVRLEGERPEDLSHPFETANDLFHYFLLDVELQGCARTSRVAAAIGSVQLYVHRVLMNLEQDRREAGDPLRLHVRPESIPPEEWTWRRNYRVWEANRKVFLYPENYIEPELRDDKTQLFEMFESELLQDEINEQTVLDAYAKYLNGFDELSRLTIAGVYHDIDEASERDVLHLFGVNSQDPPIYYYRTAENAYHGPLEGERGVSWSAWRRVDVQISARKVGPVVHDGRLYVFWVDIATRPHNDVVGGSSRFTGYRHRLSLKYTTLRLDGAWSPPQTLNIVASGEDVFLPGSGGVVWDPIESDSNDLHYLETKYERWTQHEEPHDAYTLSGPSWEGVYPDAHHARNAPHLSIAFRNFTAYGEVDLFGRRAIVNDPGHERSAPISSALLCMRREATWPPFRLYYGYPTNWYSTENAFANLIADSRRMQLFNLDYRTEPLHDGLYTRAVARFPGEPDDLDLTAVSGSIQDVLVQQGGDALLLQGSVRSDAHYLLTRITSTLGDAFAEKLFLEGLDGLLDTSHQMSLQEAALPMTLENERIEVSPVPVGGDLLDPENVRFLRFTGPMGVYYREIFFHIPFLIANHLNSQQRFAAAQRWYHYIFDPTAAPALLEGNFDATERAAQERDRVWRYREFRGLEAARLRALLTDPEALDAYRNDPFNPHAIARLRLTAYQKSIVMKYIDNLLDWGDSLFAQFKRESVNEATLLYVMAQDILGPRPAELGACGEGNVVPKTYESIRPHLQDGEEILVELETIVLGRRHWSSKPRRKQKLKGLVGRQTTEKAARKAKREAKKPAGQTSAGLFRPYRHKQTRIGSWQSHRVGTFTKNDANLLREHAERLEKETRRRPSLEWSLVTQLGPLFCVPGNKELRAYWDRVEDRLYKIRHCQDIQGVRRELALFAPEIDPRLLVRMRAAGISLEDVLGASRGDLPPYRFSYLIAKAKGFTATLQGLGGALAAALEKKDAEELARLRTVHQQNVQKLARQSRVWEIDAAQSAIASVEQQHEAAVYRRDYYQGLLDTGLTQWESAQQTSRHVASGLMGAAGLIDTLAGLIYLLPQIGSPFAMKYGGEELGNSANAFATVLRDAASMAEAISASAGLEAGYERRVQGWEHQRDLAKHDLNRLDTQLEAARIRHEIALRALEIHDATVAQTEELFELFEDKFSNLGLYTWLSTTLQRLFREAYGAAWGMARLAEQAYHFEREDDAVYIDASYWETGRAGLLAGERLLLDLNRMEQRFIESHYRTPEINQSFSLAQIDPAALIALKQTGSCEFELPELYFDLFYPGQYKRRIKAVRLTIPCITGPYTNVSAKLTLRGSRMRMTPTPDPAALRDVPRTRSVSVATSTAQGDGGVFDINFRDERYMPFEGAGCVSDWRLELPRAFRPFDYESINDVILNLSYTAAESETLRQRVEEADAELEGSLHYVLTHGSLRRVFSLRQEFSGELHRLLRSPAGTAVSIELSDKHFPLFLRGRQLIASAATLLLSVPEGQATDGLALELNAAPVTGFTPQAGFGQLPGVALEAGVLPQGPKSIHQLAVVDAGSLAPDEPDPAGPALHPAKVRDLLVAIDYRLPTPSG